ncbi:MAG: hypothetical protein M0R74_08860 [Dehalococcoidia bacterium]|nr:hypothetical protein [Dehalococcoidia bacterium]
MATRVITERLLVRAARRNQRETGCAEDELVRLCQRRDHLVSDLEKVENRVRRLNDKNDSVSI